MSDKWSEYQYKQECEKTRQAELEVERISAQSLADHDRALDAERAQADRNSLILTISVLGMVSFVGIVAMLVFGL